MLEERQAILLALGQKSGTVGQSSGRGVPAKPLENNAGRKLVRYPSVSATIPQKSSVDGIDIHLADISAAQRGVATAPITFGFPYDNFDMIGLPGPALPGNCQPICVTVSMTRQLKSTTCA